MLGADVGPAPNLHIKTATTIFRGAIIKTLAMMQSTTFQGPQASDELGDGKDTANQSPFLLLPAEIRNKIYRYSMVEGQSGDYIRGFVQPQLTRVNRQIRSEALPIYYGQNKFILPIPHTTTQRDPNAWSELMRMFKAFKAGRTGGRGTGSLQFIRDLNCEMISTCGVGLSFLEVCFQDSEGQKIPSDDDICECSWNCSVKFTGARGWEDRASVFDSVGGYLGRLGVLDGTSVLRLISTVVMVAKECPGATKEVHFHSDFHFRELDESEGDSSSPGR